jgi:hypothetical protein
METEVSSVDVSQPAEIVSITNEVANLSHRSPAGGVTTTSRMQWQPGALRALRAQ